MSWSSYTWCPGKDSEYCISTMFLVILKLSWNINFLKRVYFIFVCMHICVCECHVFTLGFPQRLEENGHHWAAGSSGGSDQPEKGQSFACQVFSGTASVLNCWNFFQPLSCKLFWLYFRNQKSQQKKIYEICLYSKSPVSLQDLQPLICHIARTPPTLTWIFAIGKYAVIFLLTYFLKKCF